MYIHGFVIENTGKKVLLFASEGVIWVPRATKKIPLTGSFVLSKFSYSPEKTLMLVSFVETDMMLNYSLLSFLRIYLPRPVIGDYVEDELVSKLYYRIFKSLSDEEDIIEIVKLMNKIRGEDIFISALENIPTDNESHINRLFSYYHAGYMIGRQSKCHFFSREDKQNIKKIWHHWKKYSDYSYDLIRGFVDGISSNLSLQPVDMM